MHEENRKAQARFMELRFLSDANPPRAIMSTARSGDMGFLSGKENLNRQAFFEMLGIGKEKVIALELHHTRNVIVAVEGSKQNEISAAAGAIGGADGIICEKSSLITSITVADCMPIWIFDESRRAYGLLHSGWKGTGILKVAIETFYARFGSSPADLSIILGPCIGPCCYYVPEDRAVRFESEFGSGSVRKIEDESGTLFTLDLRSANLALADTSGIKKIANFDLCTYCREDLGSYRREGPGAFTRMVALCGYF
jgi:polyphenol oxidase